MPKFSCQSETCSPISDRVIDFQFFIIIDSNNIKKQKSLARWRKRVGKEKAAAISSRSASRGTKYHSIVEDYFNNELKIDEYKETPLPVFMFHNSKRVPVSYTHLPSPRD